MELQLKRIRESKKISQKQMAQMVSERIGKEIKTRTYGSWERQEVDMDLEQAYYCASILGCTLNDLVGMKSDELTDSEAKLVDDYRATNSDWQDVISEQAANAAKEHPKTVSKSVERWTA